MSITLTTSGIPHAFPDSSLTEKTQISVVFNNPSKTPTQLTMDPLPKLELFVGDELNFSGKLLNADGDGTPNKSIKIYAQTPTPESALLTSVTTGIDGSFEAIWHVKLPIKHASQEEASRKKSPGQTVSIYAVFDGDEKLAGSKSKMQVITVKVKDLITIVKSDKTQYSAGEKATIFIAFREYCCVESDFARYYGDFVDPTTIKGSFDGNPLELQKKKEGSYIFITPNLTKEHHQLIVVPQKEGFYVRVGYYTILIDGLR